MEHPIFCLFNGRHTQLQYGVILRQYGVTLRQYSVPDGTNVEHHIWCAYASFTVHNSFISRTSTITYSGSVTRFDSIYIAEPINANVFKGKQTILSESAMTSR